MNGENSTSTNYQAKAFSELWKNVDNNVSNLIKKYSKQPIRETEQQEYLYMNLFVGAISSHIQIVSACTLLESLMTKEFEQYGDHLKKNGDQSHFRWKNDSKKSLSPQYVFKNNGNSKEKNFIDGHIQLCQACVITPYMDADLIDFLKCMFLYRNHVVENGLEWNKDNLNKFKSKVSKKIIKKYFTKSTVDNQNCVYLAKPKAVQKLRSHINGMSYYLDIRSEKNFNSALTETTQNLDDMQAYFSAGEWFEEKSSSRMNKFHHKLISILTELNWSQKCYLYGALLFPFWLIFSLLPFDDISRSFLQGILLCAGLGTIRDFIIIYKKIWATLIGKALLLLLYAFLTNMSFAISSQAVNEIINVETPMIYSISFISILIIPIFVFGGAIVLTFAMALFSPLYFMFSLLIKDIKKIPMMSSIVAMKTEPYPLITMGVRVMAIIVFLSLIKGFGDLYKESYIDFIEKQASAFIYNFEAYPKSRCKLEEGERSISINDHELVIANKEKNGDYTFTLSKCVPIVNNL